MRITGPQMQLLRDALLQAFPPEEFDDMLLFQLDIRRTDLTPPGSQEQVVINVIKKFNYWNKIENLLVAARKSNSNDPDLNSFAGQFRAATQLPAEVSGELELERMLNKANGYLNPRQWREQMSRIENQICRIEIQTAPPMTGTGFLLSSDIVMTNYHVVEPVLKQKATPKDVKLRFDFALLSDGLTPDPGTVFELANDWLVAKSEYSPLDSQFNPAEEPGPDQLDYALLRINRCPGNEPPGGSQNKDANASARGWIKLPEEAHDFMKSPAMLIMQHPEGQPLKLSFNTQAVISVNEKHTRVRYLVNTEKGSSGSPCFNADWGLVALHHAGDPNYSIFHKPTYNQGIPITTILENLGSVRQELKR